MKQSKTNPWVHFLEFTMKAVEFPYRLRLQVQYSTVPFNTRVLRLHKTPSIFFSFCPVRTKAAEVRYIYIQVASDGVSTYRRSVETVLPVIRRSLFLVPAGEDVYPLAKCSRLLHSQLTCEVIPELTKQSKDVSVHLRTQTRI